MIVITNEKVAGFTPIWASYRGFSLLFDNPGKNLSPMEENRNLQRIDCDCSDPHLEFYKTLEESLSDIEQLNKAYLFCPLPSYSYHVTVWDGLNDANIQDLSRSHRFDAEDFLKGLPNSLCTDNNFTKYLSGEPLQILMRCPVDFEFEKLTKWGNSVLVARLKPTDKDSEDCLKLIKLERSKVLSEYRKRFEVKTSTSSYSPHVSLGYFANKELAELATPQIDAWTGKFRRNMAKLIISFKSINLYGFTDMATFFK